MDRKYGWRRDLPDPRDRRISAPTPAVAISLPPKFSLLPQLAPVQDQRELGSCTGQAVCGVAHYREKTDALTRIIQPSVLFQYYNTRSLMGTIREDSGASIRDSIKALSQFGVADNRLWPYDPKKFARKPPSKAYTEAKKHAGVSYSRVEQNLDAIKYRLFKGDPVIFGFSVYSSFETDVVARTGVMPVPGPRDKLRGGHAVYFFGWDDAKRAFETRNSWGARWGVRGNFWFPYTLAVDPDISADFWTFGVLA